MNPLAPVYYPRVFYTPDGPLHALAPPGHIFISGYPGPILARTQEEITYYISLGFYVWNFLGQPLTMMFNNSTQRYQIIALTLDARNQARDRLHFQIADHPGAFRRQIRRVDHLAYGLGVRIRRWARTRPHADYENPATMNRPLDIELANPNTLAPNEMACLRWLDGRSSAGFNFTRNTWRRNVVQSRDENRSQQS